MPDSDRLEREIEEILGKIEQFPEADARRRRARHRAFGRVGAAVSRQQQAIARQLGRVSISQVMLLAFLMILGSFFFRRMSPLLMEWVMYAGIVLFVSSFAIMMFSGGPRGSGGGRQTKWRGRTVHYGPHGGHARPTLSQRLRRWWSNRGTRR